MIGIAYRCNSFTGEIRGDFKNLISSIKDEVGEVKVLEFDVDESLRSIAERTKEFLDKNPDIHTYFSDRTCSLKNLNISKDGIVEIPEVFKPFQDIFQEKDLGAHRGEDFVEDFLIVLEKYYKTPKRVIILKNNLLDHLSVPYITEAEKENISAYMKKQYEKDRNFHGSADPTEFLKRIVPEIKKELDVEIDIRDTATPENLDTAEEDLILLDRHQGMGMKLLFGRTEGFPPSQFFLLPLEQNVQLKAKEEKSISFTEYFQPEDIRKRWIDLLK